MIGRAGYIHEVSDARLARHYVIRRQEIEGRLLAALPHTYNLIYLFLLLLFLKPAARKLDARITSTQPLSQFPIVTHQAIAW